MRHGEIVDDVAGLRRVDAGRVSWQGRAASGLPAAAEGRSRDPRGQASATLSETAGGTFGSSKPPGKPMGGPA